MYQQIFSEYVMRALKLEIGTWLIFYGLTRVEMHGEKENKLLADGAFKCNNPPLTSAVLRPKFSDMLCI